ncbi:hypothetical protein BLNAU_2726 [Blattamonas nauphoetae]|uniref:Uncharacterized protein n=1 Tax=Blattamonas nauphoetae TaxID=2049346 RepID=A0ABQ9YFK3_9EUKA|nr:hypothetical protein BLNAU_2726 [Blattamonas nauphoetae]
MNRPTTSIPPKPIRASLSSNISPLPSLSNKTKRVTKRPISGNVTSEKPQYHHHSTKAKAGYKTNDPFILAVARPKLRKVKKKKRTQSTQESPTKRIRDELPDIYPYELPLVMDPDLTVNIGERSSSRLSGRFSSLSVASPVPPPEPQNRLFFESSPAEINLFLPQMMDINRELVVVRQSEEKFIRGFLVTPTLLSQDSPHIPNIHSLFQLEKSIRLAQSLKDSPTSKTPSTNRGRPRPKVRALEQPPQPLPRTPTTRGDSSKFITLVAAADEESAPTLQNSSVYPIQTILTSLPFLPSPLSHTFIEPPSPPPPPPQPSLSPTTLFVSIPDPATRPPHKTSVSAGDSQRFPEDDEANDVLARTLTSRKVSSVNDTLSRRSLDSTKALRPNIPKQKSSEFTLPPLPPFSVFIGKKQRGSESERVVPTAPPKPQTKRRQRQLRIHSRCISSSPSGLSTNSQLNDLSPSTRYPRNSFGQNPSHSTPRGRSAESRKKLKQRPRSTPPRATLMANHNPAPTPAASHTNHSARSPNSHLFPAIVAVPSLPVPPAPTSTQPRPHPQRRKHESSHTSEHSISCPTSPPSPSPPSPLVEINQDFDTAFSSAPLSPSAAVVQPPSTPPSPESEKTVEETEQEELLRLQTETSDSLKGLLSLLNLVHIHFLSPHNAHTFTSPLLPQPIFHSLQMNLFWLDVVDAFSDFIRDIEWEADPKRKECERRWQHKYDRMAARERNGESESEFEDEEEDEEEVSDDQPGINRRDEDTTNSDMNCQSLPNELQNIPLRSPGYHVPSSFHLEIQSIRILQVLLSEERVDSLFRIVSGIILEKKQQILTSLPLNEAASVVTTSNWFDTLDGFENGEEPAKDEVLDALEALSVRMGVDENRTLGTTMSLAAEIQSIQNDSDTMLGLIDMLVCVIKDEEKHRRRRDLDCLMDLACFDLVRLWENDAKTNPSMIYFSREESLFPEEADLGVG